MPDGLLTITLFVPFLAGLVILCMPRHQVRMIRSVALAGASATFALVLAMWLGLDPPEAGLQYADSAPWIPAIGASYHVAVDGLSLPLMAVSALLFVAVMLYCLERADRPRSHAFLLLLMETGVLGTLAAHDLLLLYTFFELALVPVYFLIAGWSVTGRRAAMKLFLYTRVGSLAMLLSLLALYLSVEPHTFSLPALIDAQPLAGTPATAALIALGLIFGLGLKMAIAPLHGWFPDAHADTPTEASVALAAIYLPLGGYGLVRVLLPIMPAGEWGWVLVILGLFSLLYGAVAAIIQSDLKRLVGHACMAHLACVVLGTGAAAVATDPAAARLAISGATYQMLSHTLLTGGLLFMTGMLQERAGTREIARLGGLFSRQPAWSAILTVLALGALGLPGLAGFVAWLLVISALVAVSPIAATVVALGAIVTTGMYLRVIARMLTADAPADMPAMTRPPTRHLGIAACLAAAAIALGIAPGAVLDAIDGTAGVLTLTRSP